MTRQCNECTLCCKLLPMSAAARPEALGAIEAMVEAGLAEASAFAGAIEDFDKPAGERCPHQRHGKGCSVYSRRPFGCRMWQCRWLAEDDTAELRRPDRSHYVVDLVPDFVKTDEGKTVPVIQIWCDPNYRDAHRDPALRAFLIRRAAEGYCALVRFDAHMDCLFLYYDGQQFHEKTSRLTGEQPHTALEKLAALGGMTVTLSEP
jgi:Putative zinc- or iron-chelating domain